jgi:hypothetical protein
MITRSETAAIPVQSMITSAHGYYVDGAIGYGRIHNAVKVLSSRHMTVSEARLANNEIAKENILRSTLKEINSKSSLIYKFRNRDLCMNKYRDDAAINYC